MPSIRFKHGATTHTVELTPSECPYKKIGKILGIPPTALTIIRAGKKLPPMGDADMPSHIVPGAMYLVTGTRPKDALPSTTRRYVWAATDVVTDFYSRLTWDFFIALLFWLWGLVIGFARACVGFVTSMVVAPDPERRPAVRQPPPQEVPGQGEHVD